MKKPIRAMPITADANMVSAAYMLIETMPKGSDERHKRIVAEIWRVMAEVAPTARTGGLTKRMEQIHEVICEYIAEHDMPPTYEEIGIRVNRHKSDVYYAMKSLKRRGFLDYDYKASRSIRILRQPGEY